MGEDVKNTTLTLSIALTPIHPLVKFISQFPIQQNVLRTMQKESCVEDTQGRKKKNLKQK